MSHRCTLAVFNVTYLPTMFHSCCYISGVQCDLPSHHVPQLLQSLSSYVADFLD
ncbi:hypothetical protein DPMN_057428 [Dreissena polymorpha]|uniref:Uncharacterized protein n=1 Tax=Dreissena polymorpha TaxID=45954 RepID=A0A9D4C053_DREPO|nr:hypothetical protein DPMN_057428 [Dreissena polymorpha]